MRKLGYLSLFASGIFAHIAWDKYSGKAFNAAMDRLNEKKGG